MGMNSEFLNKQKAQIGNLVELNIQKSYKMHRHLTTVSTIKNAKNTKNSCRNNPNYNKFRIIIFLRYVFLKKKK